MTTTLCQSGAAILKAGANVSGAAFVEADYTQIINQVEGAICADSKYDWVTNYTSCGANVKYILEEVASNLAAIYLIMHDMKGYPSRIDAEDKINVLRDRALHGLAMLRDKETAAFVRDPTKGTVL